MSRRDLWMLSAGIHSGLTDDNRSAAVITSPFDTNMSDKGRDLDDDDGGPATSALVDCTQCSLCLSHYSEPKSRVNSYYRSRMGHQHFYFIFLLALVRWWLCKKNSGTALSICYWANYTLTEEKNFDANLKVLPKISYYHSKTDPKVK